jgi:hypothetical protein
VNQNAGAGNNWAKALCTKDGHLVPESAPSVEQQAIILKAGIFECLGSCSACRKLAPTSRSEAGTVLPLSKGKQEKKNSFRRVSPKPARSRSLICL